MRNAFTRAAGLAALSGWTAAAGAASDPVEIGDATWHRSEWRASTFEMSAQSQAAIAVSEAGEIVAVWSSRRQQGGTYGVYAQRFDADGRALGEETRVNLWTDSHQWVPAVVALPGGAAWAAWQSHGQDGYGGSIVARRLGGDPGASGGPEILVNEGWRGHQADPILARSARGEILAVWTSQERPGAPIGLRGRCFDAAGRPAGLEFEVCDDSAWHLRTPAAAYLADGGFVIAYAVGDEDPATGGVRMLRFDADGDPVGDPVEVSRPGGGGIEPALAAGPDGSVLVAWLDRAPDGDDYVVLARRFHAAEGRAPEALAGAFAVDDRVPGLQNAAAIAAVPDGGFVIAFNGPDGDGTGVFARAFDAAGVPRGGAFRVNRHVAGDQAMRAAAGTRRLTLGPDGSLLCVWSGDGGRGDDSAVHVTKIGPSESVVARAEQGVRPGMRPAVDSEAPAIAGAGPHIPPTFDPAAVDDAEREVRLGAGDIGFTAVVNTGWTPPDPHMGVGPNHVVVMTNGNISFYTKGGTRTFSQDIVGGGGFWGAQGASGFVFDPEVIYDDLSGRFFVMAADRNSGNGRSYSLVGVSDDSDPNGTWYKYSFDTTALAGSLFDSPNIGVDADVVYITGDGFGGPRPYPMYTYDKASMLVGDPPATSRAFWLNTSTQSAGIPPVSYDDPPALYMIEHREASTNTSVRLIALQDPLGTPTFTETSLTVPAYGNRPESPPQAGTSSRPNTFDARFWSVAYRNGSLWACHHINQSRVLARWYEIAMNGWPDSGDTPVLVQSGEVDPGPTVRTFFNAITVDDFGNAAMVYARSAPDEFISMETSFRYASDPLGTMRPGVQRQVNTGPYTAGRWGDYGAINVDPVDGKTLWAHHEYASGSSWRTWVQGFTPAFSDADVNCDGTVNFDDLLRVLNAWGPCKGCPEDVDGDGDVDFDDVLEVLSEWS